MGKSVDTKSLSNLPKRIKHWDLLFVDDHGKILSFQHVKGLVVLFMIMLLISLSVSIYLYFLYKNTEKKINELQNTLEISQQDATAMQQEMRSLMVRLAEAQSKVPKKLAKKGIKPAKQVSSSTKKTKPPAAQPAKTKTAKTKKTPPKQSTASKTVKPKGIPAAASSKAGRQTLPQKIEVGVFDFSASFDPELNVLKTRFILKNINRNIPDISGRIFIVMKERDDDQKGWLSIPDAKLVSGKPSPVKDGHFFKIRNYKTVELQSGNITGPRAFKKASVLVFSSTGELVLEKAYRVQIDVASPEKVPPTQESAPPLQQQKESPSSDTVEEKPALKQNDKENVISEKTPEKDATENADPASTE
jgi:hypothetical protein